MKTKNTLQTRREFLRTSMLGAAATWTLPVFLEQTFFVLDAMAANAVTQTVTGQDGTILVVLQLAGGNDGLNMVVPYADDAYHRARPRLALPKEQILTINHHVGLNPKLTGLKSLYEDGNLANGIRRGPERNARLVGPLLRQLLLWRRSDHRRGDRRRNAAGVCGKKSHRHYIFAPGAISLAPVS